MRFATRPYAAPAASNLATATMHLTNYAVNKAHAAELSAAAAAAAVPIAAEAQAGAGGSGCSMPPQDGLQTSHSSSTTACSSSGPVGVSGTKWSLAQLRAHLEAQGRVAAVMQGSRGCMLHVQSPAFALWHQGIPDHTPATCALPSGYDPHHNGPAALRCRLAAPVGLHQLPGGQELAGGGACTGRRVHHLPATQQHHGQEWGSGRARRQQQQHAAA